MNQRFPKAKRLRRRQEFLRLKASGLRVHTRHFVIILGRGTRGETRLGVTVTKRVANAVGRNRVKRVVRELFRKNPELFPKRSELVFIAKAGATNLTYDQALAEVARASGAMRRRLSSRSSAPR